MNLQIIILSDVSEREIEKYRIIILFVESKKLCKCYKATYNHQDCMVLGTKTEI